MQSPGSTESSMFRVEADFSSLCMAGTFWVKKYFLQLSGMGLTEEANVTGPLHLLHPFPVIETS